MRTSDGGVTWQETPVLDGAQASLSGVTCATSTECYAVGGTLGGTIVTPGTAVLLATQDGGQTWSQVTIPSGFTTVADISCPGAGACFALAGAQSSVTGLLTGVSVLTNAPSDP